MPVRAENPKVSSALDSLRAVALGDPDLSEDWVGPRAHDPDAFCDAVEAVVERADQCGLPPEQQAELILRILRVLTKSRVTLFADEVRREGKFDRLVPLQEQADEARRALQNEKREEEAKRLWRKFRRGTIDDKGISDLAERVKLQSEAEEPDCWLKGRTKRLYGERARLDFRKPRRSSILTELLLRLEEAIRVPFERHIHDANAKGNPDVAAVPSYREIAAMVLRIARAYLPPAVTRGLTVDSVRKRVDKAATRHLNP